MELPAWYPDLHDRDIELEPLGDGAEIGPPDLDVSAEMSRHFAMWGFDVLLGEPDPEQELALDLIGGFRIDGAEYAVWLLEERPESLFSGDYYLLGAFRPEGWYLSAYSNYRTTDPHKVLTLEQFVFWDHHRFRERQRVLAPYRERARRAPDSAELHHELGLVTFALWEESRPDALNQGPRLWPGPLDEAEPPLRRAWELEPENDDYRRTLAWLLDALRRDDEAAALGLDAEPWTEELVAAGEAVRRRREGLEVPSDRQLAEACRAEVVLVEARVPETLRDLAPLARRWGIGDDWARGYFTRQATADDRRALQQALTGRTDDVEAWIRTFGDDPSDEAAAFRWLLEAAEEMDAL